MKNLPKFVPDGESHGTLNVPLSFTMRQSLARLLKRLMATKRELDTIMACEATEEFESLATNLYEILICNFRLKRNRDKVKHCFAAHEKNLSPAEAKITDKDNFSLADFAITCGLILAIFLMIGHLDYIQITNK